MMPTPPPPPRTGRSDGFKATIVLIGMRGAGKTHLGRAAAAALGLPFIDMDHLYEAEHGKIMDTVNTEGWPTFRQREVALLKRTLAEDAEGGRGRVVACGGGIVETEAGRELLRAHWPVVQAMKPIDDVEWYLGIDASRPSLGEPPRVAYARRAGWYDACADFDHMAAPRRFLDHDAAAAAFVVHVRRACGLVPPTPLPPAPSFALSLACADVAAAMPLPSALWANGRFAQLA
jgi:pentafunctional AROM polypeptide